MAHADTPHDVLVVGGGVVGLGVAWRLGQRGARVAVLEKGEVGRGASWAAAGMLAPVAELGFEELDLYALSRESLRRWPTFARDLEAETGQSVDYCTDGTLVVAPDRDDAAALRRSFRFQQEHGAEVRWLSRDAALDLEPFLSPRIAAAVHAPGDHQVDNRGLVEALRVAVDQHEGIVLHVGVGVRAIYPDAAQPRVVLDDGSERSARQVVLAAGAWSRSVDGLAPAEVPIRPVKGQMLSLRMDAPVAGPPFGLRHVVRAPHAYLVPKSDGRLVIGATSEEQSFDTRVTAGGLYRLLEGAWEACPGIEDLDVIETWAGLRPASRDHAPLLGDLAPGVVAATGHYRHGILLTPVTADEIAALIIARLAGSAAMPDVLAPFAPGRF
ncbi:MAG: glycine oxidase ThiO [Bacteroidota bacterium]